MLHVLEQAYLAEIIDPETTGPIATGGTGELVLTTLGRHGSPLIRYRTGDLVTPPSRRAPAAGSTSRYAAGSLAGPTTWSWCAA
ncbi:MAG: hypothetical protein CM1200mP34_4710 [Verrucomicrobiales bacterium]|nr:MAG: hypothetical protein CM1200mP34_4710 [Verrucomicrobiales bacterium]